MAAVLAAATIICLCSFIINNKPYYVITAALGAMGTMLFTLSAIEEMINNAIANKSAETKIKTTEPKSE